MLAATILTLASAAGVANAAALEAVTSTGTTLVARAHAKIQYELHRMHREQQASVENITRHMTTTAALQILAKNTNATSDVLSALQELLHEGGRSGRSARVQLRAHAAGSRAKRSSPTGYGGLDSAKTMLNTMLNEVTAKYEFEVSRCKEFFTSQCSLMETCRQDISTANAASARFRGLILDAQAEINVCEVNLPRLKNEYEEHNKQCALQLSDLDVSLRVVLDDIDVMTRVLQMTDCNTPTASFLLLQCRHQCKNGGFLAFHHVPLRRELSRLKSPGLRQLVQQGLMEVVKGSGKYKLPAVVFLQGAEEVEQPMPYVENVTNFTNQELVPVRLPADPCSGITYDNGAGKGKCSLASNPQCYKLQSKFLSIQGGILDKKDELLEQIKALEESCEEIKQNYEKEIEQFEIKHKGEQTKLATSTDGENGAAEDGRLKGQEHQTLEKDMLDTRNECSTNMRTFESEMCGLKKIRGELYKMQGSSGFFQDCEVTEWQEEECSATCGGGTSMLTRKVVSRPQGGMSCPPLRAVKRCNEQPCPVDCELSIWSGWSGCSAECNGGVIERMRQVEVETRYDGTPCGETTESVSCNMQACDVDCELEDWSAWSQCSKACDKGTNVRRRAIKTPARGEGKCWKVDSEERLESRYCNTMDCHNLKCISKMDVLLMLDGSSSIGEAGWNATKAFADLFLSAFEGNGTDAQVSVLIFSGPRTWSEYRTCVGSDAGEVNETHMRSVCGINMVQHFTPRVSDARALVSASSWPQGTTLTSVALRMAEAEIKLSRGDAPSAVVAVTDGLPLSPRMTAQASLDLKQSARLLFAPVDLQQDSVQSMREWASTPVSENLVNIASFQELETRTAVDLIVADMCPLVEATFDDVDLAQQRQSLR